MSIDKQKSATKKSRTVSRLGRGLSALISSELLNESPAAELTDDVYRHTVLKTVPLTDIVPNKEQPRSHFDEEGLQSLAASIKDCGLLQPILVQELKKQGNHQIYRIIAGERRWRACHKANLTEVPVLICQSDLDSATLLKQALIENVQREDLNPIEEAKAYRKLAQEFHLDQEEIAQMSGKSRPVISNMQRLLNLPLHIQGMLEDKRLNVGQAKPLLQIDDQEYCLKLAQLIHEQNLSAREVEKKVQEYLSKLQKDSVVEEEPNGEWQRLAKKQQQQVEEKLSTFFGQKVKLRENKGKGSIVLSYDNYDELDQILAKIGIDKDL